MFKMIIVSLFISLLGFILGAVICFSLTTVFWKLEPMTGLELAGHSGPADWLIILFGSIFAIIAFALSFSTLKKSKS